MRKALLLLLLVTLTSLMFAATIDVSKPVKITNDTDYDRGNDIAYGNGYYWLAYGKSQTGETEYDEVYGNGNPDHNNYHTYYKKATSIAGLADATEVKLMYDSSPAVNMSSYGESWIEYFDGKIFIVLSEYDEANGKNIKLFWTDDEGDTWNKVDNIVNATAQHCDIEIFNNEMYLAWGTSICHLSDPTSSAAWVSAVASKYTLPSSSGTARFFADKTDPSPANHMLYLACLNNAWNGGLVYTYILSTDSWDAGNTIEYAAYDPVLTKYNDNFIYLQAPWITPHQSYLYAYTSDVDEFIEENFRLFDESAYNVGEPVGDNDYDWVCMWGQAIIDLYGGSPSENTVVFYSSERNDVDPSLPRNADIYSVEMSWDLGNNHYTFINSALYGAICDMEEITVPFEPAADGDVINVISGTYIENVVIAENLTLEGNMSAVIDPGSGVAVTVDGAYTVEISEFCIMDGLTNNGGTVDARYNYWGSAAGPGAAIVNNARGTVDYIPWYTDAEMTTLGYPLPAASLAYDGAEATITWSALADGGVTYKVYYTSDPSGSWTDDGAQTSPYVDATTDAYKFYKVVAVAGGTEWNEGAAELGYFTHVMNKVVDSYGYNFVSLCLDYGVSTVSALGTELGIGSGETISLWGTADQAWITCTYNGSSWDQDPEIMTGMAVLVEVGNDKTAYLTGSLPAEWATFNLVTTATTAMNMAYLPLNMASLTDLEAVGIDIGVANCNSISLWDATNQGWTTASYLDTWEFWLNGDITIEIGDVIMLGALQNFTWPD
jgi:hypothetical protein